MIIDSNLNGRLLLVITAVTLSMSFLSDPSVSIRVRDLKELEKPFINGGYTNNDQVDEVMKEVFLRKSETDGWHTLAYYVGLVCAWPIGDQFGRKRGLLYSNIFRFSGIILHFVALIVSVYSNQNALAMNHSNDLVSMNENDTANDTFTSLFISISLSSKLADGVFSGLTTVLGILYVYEVSPKTPSSSKVCSLSIMAYYMFVKSAAEYIIVVILPPLQYSPVNYTTWYISGSVSIVAGVMQLTLLFLYCPETPSYLAVQERKTEEAKNALIHLRETEDVTEELEEIEKDSSVREFLKRSMFLVSLYLVFTLYNGFFLFMGFAHAVCNDHIVAQIAEKTLLILKIVSVDHEARQINIERVCLVHLPIWPIGICLFEDKLVVLYTTGHVGMYDKNLDELFISTGTCYLGKIMPAFMHRTKVYRIGSLFLIKANSTGSGFQQWYVVDSNDYSLKIYSIDMQKLMNRGIITGTDYLETLDVYHIDIWCNCFIVHVKVKGIGPIGVTSRLAFKRIKRYPTTEDFIDPEKFYSDFLSLNVNKRLVSVPADFRIAFTSPFIPPSLQAWQLDVVGEPVPVADLVGAQLTPMDRSLEVPRNYIKAFRIRMANLPFGFQAEVNANNQQQEENDDY